MNFLYMNTTKSEYTPTISSNLILITARLLFILLVVIGISSCSGNEIYEDPDEKKLSYVIDGVTYRAGNWDHPNYTDPFSTYGNHRFLVETNPGDTLVQVVLPWRRHDPNPQSKDIIIVDTVNNEEIIEKRILHNDNEKGHFIFKPRPTQEQYYIYYLPHESTGGYYPKVKYINPTDNSDLFMAGISADKIDELPIVRVLEAQSIDDFHSFYPMEVISTSEELDSFLSAHERSWYLFPEYRDYPIVMKDYLPYRWVHRTYTQHITDKACKGEYYTFQIGVFSPSQILKDIHVSFSDLTGKDGSKIDSHYLTCFNTGGIDLNGVQFTKDLQVPIGNIQPLWIGLDIPENLIQGKYTGKVTISPDGLPAEEVEINLHIGSDLIKNYGDDVPENMSRLRWLNSTIGSDTSFIVPPFQPVEIEESTINILGRKIVLGANGLPVDIQSSFSQ